MQAGTDGAKIRRIGCATGIADNIAIGPGPGIILIGVVAFIKSLDYATINLGIVGTVDGCPAAERGARCGDGRIGINAEINKAASAIDGAQIERQGATRP
ncbi:Uncharacterised protein [Brucella suis]|nr:Uncharacterised protein [Brucella suis]